MANYIQLPMIVLLLLCLAALFMFGAEIYSHYSKRRYGVMLVLHRKPMCVIFLVTLFANVILSFLIMLYYRTELQSMLPSAAARVTDTLVGDSQLSFGHSFYVDTLSACSVFFVAVLSLIIALRAMADKHNRLTPPKIACMLLVIASVEATYYAGSYYAIFFFILMSQVASYGLFKHASGHKNRMLALMFHNLFRLVGMLLLLTGVIMLSARYSPSIIRLVSRTINMGAYEKIMFAFIFSALLAFFLRPATNSNDPIYRICFAMRSQAIYFVFLRTLFAIFGAVNGLEKIPNVLIAIGGCTILCALFMSISSAMPSKFCNYAEMFMKGFLVTATGVAFYACFNAEGLAQYGFTSLEAMLLLWFLYLPLFSIMAIVSCNIERKIEGVELYKYGGLMSLTPYSVIALLLMVFCFSGIPPLVTYPFMQLLLRSATFISPFLAIFLVITVLTMFFAGVYIIVTISFGKIWSQKFKAAVSAYDNEILLSSGLLLLWIAILSICPGLLLQKVIAPSVESLMNTGDSVNVIEEVQQ